MQNSYKRYEMQDSKKYGVISTDNMEQIHYKTCHPAAFWILVKGES